MRQIAAEKAGASLRAWHPANVVRRSSHVSSRCYAASAVGKWFASPFPYSASKLAPALSSLGTLSAVFTGMLGIGRSEQVGGNCGNSLWRRLKRKLVARRRWIYLHGDVMTEIRNRLRSFKQTTEAGHEKYR